MIFVYPSVVSENVPDYLYPAIAKTLEQFYLFHILESFGDGNLRVKTVYNPGKQVYGPLVLEQKNDTSKLKILKESFDLDYFPPDNILFAVTYPERIKSVIEDVMTFFDGGYHTFMKSYKITKDTSANELMVYSSTLKSLKTQAIELISKMTSVLEEARKLKARFQYNNDPDCLDSARRWCASVEMLNTNLNAKLKVLNELSSDVDSYLFRAKTENDPFKKEKNRLEVERLKDEEKKRKALQAQSHGSYMVKDTSGISLQPTMSNVQVKIHYVGGPAEGVGTAYEHDYQEIAVGTKVIPCKVQNFQKIQDAILDDYFSSRVSLFFKSKSRSALRQIFKWAENAVKRISGIDVDMVNLIKDPAKRMILLSPQGFVDASSFKHHRNTSSFYNFSSASVVFRDDDMTYEGGENFFKDTKQLQRMLKAGWNTFVIMKEIEETLYFISSLDGGALHILPYSYMFNALRMDKVYDSDEFKRRSKGFQIKSGDIGTLSDRLMRESHLFESIKKVWKHEK